VQDSLGFELGDGLFDSQTDSVDLGVELFLPVEHVPDRCPLERGDHVVSDVSLVAYPVGWIVSIKDSGQPERGGVVTAALNRVRDPAQPSVQVADDLDVQPGGLVFTGEQLGMRGPAHDQHGSRLPSTM
jgi:hypothetical protein